MSIVIDESGLIRQARRIPAETRPPRFPGSHVDFRNLPPATGTYLPPTSLHRLWTRLKAIMP